MGNVYFVRTNNQTWGYGVTEAQALSRAHYPKGMADAKGWDAHVIVLTEEPKDLQINGWGDATWSNESCRRTGEYMIRDGRREEIEFE